MSPRDFRVSKVLWLPIAFALLMFCAAPRATAAPSAGRIAFLGTDDQIYSCVGDCSKPQCITCPARGVQVRRAPRATAVTMVQEQGPPGQPEPMPPMFRHGWPTFSPDGTRIAFAWAGPAPDGNRYGISVYDFSTHQTIPIFASHTEKVIYIFWTPDGTNVSFLLNEPEGLSLILAQVKEKTPVRLVLSGAPIYYDWNRAGGRLVVHFSTGDDASSERIDLMSITPTDQEVTRTLSRGRSPFKTPCWSADGKHLAYIGNNKAEAYLVVAGADGANPKSLVSLPVGESSFVWSPDSRHIAYSTAVIGEDLVMHGIKVLDIESGESKRLSSDDVRAYFYSPDGRYLAYVGVPANLPFYVWNVADLKTGKTRKLANFLSTQDESVSYRYFDQLALSHRIWSPDSSAFVYAGVRILGEPRHPLGAAPEPSLWIVPADGSKPHSIQGATLGFFSPAMAR